MAQISTPALSAKMYRHFAVVTICATLLLAIFSDGENREAIAEEMADRKAAAEARNAPKQAYGEPQMEVSEGAADRMNAGPDLSDTNFEYGQPMDTVGAREQSVARIDATVGGMPILQYAPADYARYGISEAELAKLTPAQREALLRQLRTNGAATDADELEAQIADLLAASRERSGSSAVAED